MNATIFSKSLLFKATKQIGSRGDTICCLDIESKTKNGSTETMTIHLEEHTLDALLRGFSIDFEDYREQQQ